MGWIYTLLASGGELLMIWGLKQPHRLVVLGAWAGGSVVAGFFLNRALALLDSSSAYPVWVSTGTLGAVLMGICLYGERLTGRQLLFAALLLLGGLGLLLGGS